MQELARRLGLNWNYSDPQAIFEEMKSVMPSLDNITWERLENEGSVTYPCPSINQPGNAIIFTNGFPTPTGRGTFTPTKLVPPDEVPDKDFPMVLTTGRLLEHWHTGAMTRRATNLDALEPEAIVAMNKDDLDKYNISPGDWVSVTTRRGSITLKARLDQSISTGMLFIPFCFSEAAANILTNPKLDPVGKIPELKFCAAQIRRTSPRPHDNNI